MPIASMNGWAGTRAIPGSSCSSNNHKERAMADGFDFTGKTVMVFGGTSGINLGIAKSFARHGAKLAVASRSQDKVDAAVAALSGETPALGYSLDVRNYDAVKAAIDDFRE